MDLFNFACEIFCLCLAALTISGDDTCDKSKCLGPTAHYEDLRCEPVYKASSDCCPYKYNCDHLQTRSSDKCYANSHEYSVDEHLRDEDANPCDVGCYCTKFRHDFAQFICAVVDCFHGPLHPGCYLSRNVTHCCPGPQICPEKPEDRATCEVDGEIYRDGEFFSPKSEPTKTCVCGSGYKGENIPPFCRLPTVSRCRTELLHAHELKKCIPTYNYQQSPQQDCSYSYRCQNIRDRVIPKDPSAGPPQPGEDMICKFGTLLMRYGDQLNQAPDNYSSCMRCVCEVGPVPTCQRLSDEQCDIMRRIDPFYQPDISQ